MWTVRYDKYTKCCSECQHQYTISCVYGLHAKRPLIVACTVNSLFVGNPGSDTFALFFEISVSDGNIDIGFFPQVTLQIKLGVIKNVSAVVKPVVENKAPCLFYILVQRRNIRPFGNLEYSPSNLSSFSQLHTLSERHGCTSIQNNTCHADTAYKSKKYHAPA